MGFKRIENDLFDYWVEVIDIASMFQLAVDGVEEQVYFIIIISVEYDFRLI